MGLENPRRSMNISPDHLLAEIVDLVPGAPRVLESHGLDYCCGGQRTLLVACQEATIDPADHIEATHHVLLRGELSRLEALTDKVAVVHGSRHPELVDLHASFVALREDLEPHMAKEERVLFPMIRERSTASSALSFHCGSVANPISMMMREHEHAGSILAALRELAGGYVVPDDACASYRALYEGLAALEADTHLHIHKENNALFPAVIDLERRFS